MIIVYNTNEIDYSMMQNNVYMGQGSLFENPFGYRRGSKKKLDTKLFSTKKEMLNAYGQYFDALYENDEDFKQKVDSIYDKYKRNETIYFQCDFKTQPCYGDVIKDKMQERLLRDMQKNKAKRY